MNLFRSEGWPEIGELVVATVDRITHYGGYVTLDEYEKEGFLHVSEISSSWVRNIRDFVREGEKVVLKVLRVDPEKQHIDLSLRRVGKREAQEARERWKHNRKVESLMKSAAQKLDMPLQQVYQKAMFPLENKFGQAYEGLENAAREGKKILLEQGIPEKLAAVLTEIAKEKIRISMVKTKGTLHVTCKKPDGVLQIKETLLKVQEVKTPPGAVVKISVVSPPKYGIEVTAKDYKEANEIMKRATDIAIEDMEKAGGQVNFKRG